MKRINGFTLVELLAVIVILAIILAIAIPTIVGLIRNTTKNAFLSDAKMVIKAIDYKLLENDDFDVTTIEKDAETDTVSSELKLSTDNYESVSVAIDEFGKTNIMIVGQNKWDGLTAYGTFNSMRVVDDEEAPGSYYCAIELGNAVVGDVLTGKTFTNGDGLQTGTMPNIGAITITPGANSQVIPQGYHNGSGTVGAIPTNFKKTATGSVSIPGGGYSSQVILSAPPRYISIYVAANPNGRDEQVAWKNPSTGQWVLSNQNAACFYIDASSLTGGTTFTIRSGNNGGTVVWEAVF